MSLEQELVKAINNQIQEMLAHEKVNVSDKRRGYKIGIKDETENKKAYILFKRKKVLSWFHVIQEGSTVEVTTVNYIN